MMKTRPAPFSAVLAAAVMLAAAVAPGTAPAFDPNDLRPAQNDSRPGVPSLVTPLVPVVPGNREGRSPRRARDAVRRGEILSLEQVAQRVSRQFPGRLLDARLDESRGRPVYYLKMLTRDGRVLRIAADARTAQILGADGR
jgi:hypothetical protein